MTSRPAPETAPVPTFTAAKVESLRYEVPAGATITAKPGELPGTFALVEVDIGADTISLTRGANGRVLWEYGSALKGDVEGEHLFGGSAYLGSAVREAREYYASPTRPR